MFPSVWKSKSFVHLSKGLCSKVWKATWSSGGALWCVLLATMSDIRRCVLPVQRRNKLQHFSSFSNFWAFENWRNRLYGFTTNNNSRTNRLLISYMLACFFYNNFINLGCVVRQKTPCKIISCLKNWLATLFHKLQVRNIIKLNLFNMGTKKCSAAKPRNVPK